MAKHRTYSIEFKRQVVQEFLAGETLHALAKRHDVYRNLIRIWVQKYETGAFDEEAAAADLLQQYEARIVALERLVGRQALELEFLKGARGHDHHEVGAFHRSPGEPPRRVDPARIAMQKQPRYHPRVERRLPQRAAVAAGNRRKIKLLPHQRYHQPRHMVLGHIVLHARRQKLSLVNLPRAKILARSLATESNSPQLHQ